MSRIWGHCLTCDALVRIIPGPHKVDGRQQYWFPIRHDGPDGKPCEGSERGI